MASEAADAIAMATAVRRVWLQGIAIVALLIALVADDLQGYRGNDIFVIGAIVTVALGGHILDTIAGPAHNSPPNMRELVVYFTPAGFSLISPVSLLFGMHPHVFLVPALLSAGIAAPFVIYYVVTRPL